MMQWVAKQAVLVALTAFACTHCQAAALLSASVGTHLALSTGLACSAFTAAQQCQTCAPAEDEPCQRHMLAMGTRQKIRKKFVRLKGELTEEMLQQRHVLLCKRAAKTNASSIAFLLLLQCLLQATDHQSREQAHQLCLLGEYCSAAAQYYVTHFLNLHYMYAIRVRVYSHPRAISL
jgi:hypothetical protein